MYNGVAPTKKATTIEQTCWRCDERLMQRSVGAVGLDVLFLQ
jgi:hypothetical protein